MKLELLEEHPTNLRHKTPLLFVHGAWHGAWCWRAHFMGYFAEQGYATYALSLRGHGASEGQEKLNRTRVADYVADVSHIASQITQKHNVRPVLIGHSMGGMVVQKYLETHSAPAGVLMASLPPAGALATVLRLARRHPLIFLKLNLSANLYQMVATPALAREAFFSANMSDTLVNHYWQNLQNESFLGFFDMLVLNLPKPTRVKTPLLVLGAANDIVFHPYEVEATAHAYHTRATIFANMAHDMMLETNWREPAQHILSWLEQRNLP